MSELKQKFHARWIELGQIGGRAMFEIIRKEQWALSITRQLSYDWVKEFGGARRGYNAFTPDEEIISENVKYKRETQKHRDLNRIENKSFRESARVSNAVEEYNKEILEALKLNKPVTIKHETFNSNACGLVQLSDTHFNELIDILGNRYDFSVAAKRLKLLAIKTKKYFKAFGVKNVLLALTGDLLNSNRRLDELLSQATNRANASVLSFFLLKQFIMDLNEDFNISIASVSGNESRMEKEHGYTNILATDNFDFTIESFLRIHFMECEGIDFIEGDAREKVVNVAGQNVLILHGDDSLTKGNTQSVIQQKIGGYALKRVIIDYIIFGHVHCANVSGYSSRSASLAGSNAYNEQALNLIGRASQNVYIFYDDLTRDGVCIDLQNTGVEGYDLIKELESYHAKSASKVNQKSVIYQIII